MSKTVRVRAVATVVDDNGKSEDVELFDVRSKPGGEVLLHYSVSTPVEVEYDGFRPVDCKNTGEMRAHLSVEGWLS